MTLDADDKAWIEATFTRILSGKSEQPLPAPQGSYLDRVNQMEADFRRKEEKKLRRQSP